MIPPKVISIVIIFIFLFFESCNIAGKSVGYITRCTRYYPQYRCHSLPVQLCYSRSSNRGELNVRMSLCFRVVTLHTDPSLGLLVNRSYEAIGIPHQNIFIHIFMIFVIFFFSFFFSNFQV